MSILLRTGLAWTVAAGCALSAAAQTPTQPQPKAAPAAPTQARSAAAPAPGSSADPVLATVNGEPIYQHEVIRLLGQLSVRPGDEQRAYDSVINVLINTKLLSQFLRRMRIEVPPAQVNEVLAQYEKSAAENKESLVNQLSQANFTLDEFRDQIARTLQWRDYVKRTATEAELKKYAEANKDTFNGTKVRASHILIAVQPDASPEDKQKARAKLEAIRQEIASGKISFANAANKYSEDPGNKETPSGGDLQYFYRKEPFIEPFSAAAFALKKGQMSNIVETEYGFHLIHVTDRIEGQPYDFQRDQEQILNQYAAELQQKIVDQERKNAEAKNAIKIEPMPKGLIQPAAPAPAPTAPAPAPSAPGTTPKAATPAPATKGATPKS